MSAFLLAGCSSDEEIEYKEQSVYEIYSQALAYMDLGEYKNAAAYFDEVERQHPYSVWATKAKLMAAYALYQSNKYDDAVTALDRFIAIHPGNRDVVYAYYLKSLCYYEQIAEVQRDQELTEQALEALQDVVTRFPDTNYARDAGLKIDLTREHLAGKEMTIGRFYQRRVQYLAAINRYKTVVDLYGDTAHAAEALERLTECFTALGLIGEARKTAAVLGYNYPGGEWYVDAYDLVDGRQPKPDKALAQPDLQPPADTATPQQTASATASTEMTEEESSPLAETPTLPAAEPEKPLVVAAEDSETAPAKPKNPWYKLW